MCVLIILSIRWGWRRRWQWTEHVDDRVGGGRGCRHPWDSLRLPHLQTQARQTQGERANSKKMTLPVRLFLDVPFIALMIG